MFNPRPLLLALTLSALPLQVHARALSTNAVLPNAPIEAQTARSLNEIAPAILTRRTGSESDSQKIKLAIAFARLGRIEAGLRAANAMEVQDPDVSNGGPHVRDEVLRIATRRCALVGKIVGARDLSLQIKDPGLHTDALLAIARAQTRAGNVVDAHKTLFQALSIIGQDRNAQMYIAVLFHRAGELSAAKRVLQRVENSLPPLVPHAPQVPITEEQMASQSDWRSLARVLLKTGQIEKAAQLDRLVEGYDTSNLRRALMQTRRFDLAEKLARQKGDELDQINDLLTIAWELRPTQPERAASLWQEAEERLQKLPSEPATPTRIRERPSLSRKDFTILVVAYLHNKEGNPDKANALLGEVLQRSTPTGAAFIRLYFALMPLLFERGNRSTNQRSVLFSRSQIERISKEVNAAIPDANINQFNAGLPDFVNAQIASGALDAARQTLTLMERQLIPGANLSPRQKANDPNILNFALEVATLWQKLGDTQHVHELLNCIWDSPLARGVAPRERAWRLLAFGFLNEGKRRLATLGIEPQEPVYQYGSLAYFEGYFNPKVFPAWIQTVRDPRKKLASLDSFAPGLAESREQLPEEREFVLSSTGYSYSY